MKTAFALACAVLANTGSVLAQQSGSVRVSVDARKIGLQDTVELEIAFDGAAVDVSPNQALPSMANLEIVAGPSSAMRMSLDNGTMSRSRTLTYVLRPLREGSAEVGALRVSGYDPTEPIRIEVVKGSVRPAREADDRGPFGRDPFGDPFGGRDPFEEFFGRSRRPAPRGKVIVEAAPSRTRLRVGETFRLSYYVYTQVSLSGVEFVDAPKYPGLWAEEIKVDQGPPGGEVAFRDGEEFRKFPFLERLLIPTRPGVIEIPPSRIRLSPTAAGFGIAAPIESRTAALRIVVDPLPAHAPASGAVGSYAVSASLARETVPVGEAATFRFKVSGRGNLKWIDASPAFEIPGVKIFPPRLSTDLKATPRGIEGSKTWEYVLIPSSAGVVEIPKLSFEFFDDQTNETHVASTERLALTVTGSATPAANSSRATTVGSLALRGDLDRPGFRVPAWLLAFVFTLGCGAHYAAPRFRPLPKSASGVRVSQGAIQGAFQELDQVTRTKVTKERAALAFEAAIQSVFGDPRSWPENDQGDTLRTLIEEIQFLRAAPQLGSYDEKIRDIADRTRAVIEAERA